MRSPVSEQTRQRMSEAAKRRGSNSKGKRFSVQARLNISRGAQQRLPLVITKTCQVCGKEFQARGTRTLICDAEACQGERALLHRLRYYDLTVNQYKAMLIEQDHKCKLCGKLFNRDDCVDHDHVTNRVRGILHMRCNVNLGHLEALAQNGLLNVAMVYLQLR
jgi:predicted Zn-ribbon and HTH transcriptional regulator